MVQCPKCNLENPAGSKFCGGCGQKFELTCSACGANNPAGNRFCNECGSNLNPPEEVPDQISETKSPAAPPPE